MQAVITVTGKDSVGIIAKVSQKCVDYNVNIIDISQSVLKDYFAMIMLVEIDKLSIPFTNFVDEMSNIGQTNGLSIHTMHEDIFNSMHKI
ncbi:MAG: ACT domain-containing protein [Clostridia bacterium]|nr:ACT domain-containing protein [Clostridia bacterium]